MLSLKSRVLTSQSLSTPSVSAKSSVSGPSTQISWKSREERLHKAYDSVKEQGMTIRQASEIFWSIQKHFT